MEVRPAAGQAEIDAALALRERVFVGEQGVTVAADRDGRDPEALHIVAIDGAGLVGTCRLVFDGDVARLGRMAVERGLRGRGIGASILETAEREARERGSSRVRLHAQVAARSLYERAGYEPRGQTFLEEGIEHLTMERPLA